MKEKFYAYIEQLQDKITSKLEEIDGKAKFEEDLWKREWRWQDPRNRKRCRF